MIVPVLLFCVGLVCLIKGGDWFVDGATGIARRFHLPELLIGATVVSIGTTLPEVMVSTTSALSGHGEMAYGNTIGSVICNTALIAALSAAVRPGPADGRSLRLPAALFTAAAVAFGAVAYTTGQFSRAVGLGLLGLFLVYLILSARKMRTAPAPEAAPAEPPAPLWRTLLGLVAAGKGITFAYEAAARSLLARGLVQIMELEDLHLERPFHFVCLPDSPRAELLVQLAAAVREAACNCSQ